MRSKHIRILAGLVLCVCVLLCTLSAAFAATLSITTQPQSVIVASGKTAAVTVKAEGEGLKYQWYYAPRGSDSFSKASITTATYSVAMTDARDGRKVYCVVTDADGNKVQSDTATLNMAPKLRIVKQSAETSVVNGSTATVLLIIHGDNYTAQWYYAPKGSSAFSKASVTGDTYSINMNSTRDGRRVYCVVTDPYGQRVQSDTFTLSMIPLPKITTQPQSITVPSGETASVSVKATGEGLSYQWYYANTNSAFTKASVTGTTYSVAMNSTRNGRQVYCVITDKYGQKVTSKTATLTMAAPVKITKATGSFTVPSGMTASATVTASGEGLTYQWYYANKGVDTFSKASVTTATYSVAMNSARSGRRIYCVVTDKYGKKATSDTFTLTLAPDLKITRQPVGMKAITGNQVQATVAVNAANPTFAWYYANKDSDTFSKASITGDTYSVIMNSTRDGRRIYCVITDEFGRKVQSDTVTLGKYPDLTLTKDLVDASAPLGETVSVTAKATGEGLTYQWYYASAPGQAFARASITGPTYAVTMTEARNGRYLYCIIKDAAGQSITTNVVQISIAEAPTIITQPSEGSAYAGQKATVSVAAKGVGLKYRWYFANKGSDTFSASSVTTNEYSVAMDASRDGRRIYCVVTDQFGRKVQSDTVTLWLEHPFTTSVSNGQVTITGFSNELYSAELVIPSTIRGLPVTAIGDVAFSYSEITSLTLPSSVKTIGYEAFANCMNLSRVNLGSGVTSIGERAFYNVTNLDTIKLPSSLKNIGAGAFSLCYSLTSITIPGSVKTIPNNAFNDCNQLSSVTLSKGVTTIGEGAFFAANSLLSISLPVGVTTIGPSAFYSSALKAIYIPHTVTSIGFEAFESVYDCTYTVHKGSYAEEYFTDYELPIAYPAGAVTITKQPTDVTALNGKTATTTVEASGDGLKYQWYYRNAGSSSFVKASVTTPTYSVTMSDARDGREIYCVITDSNHNKVQTNTVTLSTPFPIFLTQQPEDIAAYDGMPVETTVAAEGVNLSYQWYYANKGAETFSKASITGPTYSLNMSAARDGRRIYCVISDPYGQSVTTNTVTLTMLDDSIFPEGLQYTLVDNHITITGYTGSQTALAIPATINGYPVTDIYGEAFCGSSLTNVKLPDSLTTIGFMAFYDSDLVTIQMPGVTSIGCNAFQNCQSLKSITFGNRLTSIDIQAFYNCSQLTSISLPDSLTSLPDDVFTHCSSLSGIKLPSGLTSIGNSAFGECAALKSITLPGTLKSIGSYAFGLSGLTSLTIPSSVTTIGTGAFSSCHYLKTLTVNANITTIPEYFLANCEGLTTLTLPSTVTTLKDYAFQNLSSMSTLTLPSGLTTIADTAFDTSYMTLRVKNKSYAHLWVQNKGLTFTTY